MIMIVFLGEKILGNLGINIIQKVFGILLLVIAVKLFSTNVPKFKYQSLQLLPCLVILYYENTNNNFDGSVHGDDGF